MKHLWLTFLCLVLSATLAEAESLVVTYLEGDVQVRSGTAWKTLEIGDTVPIDSTVRIQAGGWVQLDASGATYNFNRVGSFSIAELVAARRQLTARGVTRALTDSLKRLAFGSGPRQASVAGARGADQSKEADDDWVEGSSQIFLDAGKEYIKVGKTDEALEQLSQALEAATDAEAPQVHYYIGYALSQKGDVRGAWKEIASLRPGSAEDWAGDLVLLKAELLEDTSDYSGAVAQLLATDLSKDAQRGQLYSFLLGLGYKGLGDNAKATQALKAAVSLGAGSDLGKAASDLLGSP